VWHLNVAQFGMANHRTKSRQYINHMGLFGYRHVLTFLSFHFSMSLANQYHSAHFGYPRSSDLRSWSPLSLSRQESPVGSLEPSGP
jgi:hypothetical protein